MFDWKNDRRVQFAVGLAIVLVAAKWLFTGTLLFAIADLQSAPEDGQTRTGLVTNALVPGFVDTVVGVIIAIGAWILNLGGMLAGMISSNLRPAPAPAETSTVNDFDRRRNEVIEFAQAAADNDKETLEALRVQIRKPQALAELNEAYTVGDTESASRLKAELDAMVGAPVATRKQRGTNG